jgi:ABC-type multidrug transport system fused ATPase/permease subunit
MSTFASVLWSILSAFVFLAYLMVMFQIVVDLFRDPDMGGGSKALWIIGLIFVPIVTALVYIIARGQGMAERQRNAAHKVKAETDEYVRGVAGTAPADQIAKAKSLLDAGAISKEEFLVLKGKALA